MNAAPAFRRTFEAVLLKSRRPILLAPKKVSEHIGHNVAIAWNGTAEAASALAGAMPFLKKAVATHLLTVVTPRTVVDSTDDGEPVGAALMREAVNMGADLLVMGGYGHHSLHERILGGVTHHVLNHASLPILVAH